MSDTFAPLLVPVVEYSSKYVGATFGLLLRLSVSGSITSIHNIGSMRLYVFLCFYSYLLFFHVPIFGYDIKYWSI